ncbi:MAG: Ig-like domain-containing protein [Planctomycetaceae bacterium]
MNHFLQSPSALFHSLRRSVTRRRIRRRLCQSHVQSLEARCLLTADLVSVTPSPGPFEAGASYSTNPDVNADGRYVAFQSHADNLVSTVADTNGTQDVFVRDLQTGRTILISVNASGTDSGMSEGLSEAGASITSGSFNPAISDDGRFVAFVSHAKDLVKDLTIDITPNVYVRDRDADEDGIFDEPGDGETSTTLLSLGTDGTAAGVVAGSGASTRPVISGNGAFVAFASFAPDMAITGATDVNGSGGDVFRANLATGALELVTVSGDGLTSGSSPGRTVSDLSISTSGGGVAFASNHADLVSSATGSVDDTDALPDIFFGGGGPVSLVSVNATSTGSGNGISREPAVSGNGRHVAFFSFSTDLTTAIDTNLTEDLFVRDLKSGVTTLVSRSRAASGGLSSSLSTGDGSTPGSSLLDSEITAGPQMSEDGRFIVFKSTASDLLDPTLGVSDDNGVADIFVFDRDPDEDGRFDEPGETGTILVSVNSAGTASTGFTVPLSSAASFAPSISRSGRYVAFASTGSDLVPGVSGPNVYIRDLVTGVTSLVSESTGGVGGPDGTTPATRLVTISDDGSIVAFQSATDAETLDASVTDPSGGSTPFAEIDVFAGTPAGDILLTRNFAAGSDVHAQAFRILFDDVPPFDVSYFLSADATFDPSADTLLGTTPVTDPDDLSVDGNRILFTTIGTGAGEIAFPGVASADVTEDYFILAVADPTDAVTEFDADALNEDNTRAVRGVYHLPGGPIFVHGGVGEQSISVAVVGEDEVEVSYGTTGFGIPGTFGYKIADVSEVRIRTHDDDDVVVGSDLTEVIFGGAGSDSLSGAGGADSLFGGPGKDLLDGGEGPDLLDGGSGPDVLIGGPGDDLFFDGPGDDIVDAGPGDDIVMSTPGSDDIFIDVGGLDTLDFSLDDLQITIDLDSTAVQTVDNAHNTIRLEGVWENFVGSPFGNTVTLKPLPGVPRDVIGGSGDDLLIIDPGDSEVIDSGTEITFPGSGLSSITYSGFETVRIAKPTVRIIDDGDSGYSSTGFTRIFDEVFPQGFDDDVEYSAADSGHTATWTFTDLVPGDYNVSVTWTNAPDRAKNAPFRIYDGTTATDPTSQHFVNQELPPDSFEDQGVSWSDLGIVALTGRTLTVELTDLGADEFVLADAVRIEPLPDIGIRDVAGNQLQNGGTFSIGDLSIDSDTGLATSIQRLTLFNEGTAPVTFHSFSVTDAAFTLDTSTTAPVLPPGGSTDVVVHFSSDTIGSFTGAELFIGTSPSELFNLILNLTANVTDDTTPPTVEITSPDSGSLFIEGTAVRFSVDATDDVRLASVELLVDGTVADTISELPFLFDVVLPVGVTSSAISARATDSAGNQTTSEPVIVDLATDTPPQVQIEQPSNQQGFSEGTTVPIIVEATDDTGIRSVDFLVDDVLIETQTIEPFVARIPFNTPGEHVVRVTAFDSFGNVTSDSVNVTIFPFPLMTPGSIVVGSTDDNPQVVVMDAEGTETFRFTPFEGLTGGIHVATGDINGDGTSDIITGAGTSGGPRVKVFDGISGAEIRHFAAFEPTFRGGVFVAAGDVNGDGDSDIVVGAGAGSGPRVRIFSGQDGSLLREFLAYEPTFRGGVRLAVGDVSGDGVPDIVTGSGPGSGPRVKVFDGSSGSELTSFFAFDSAFVGGVFVATADLNRDATSDIVVGSGAGDAPSVKVFDGISGTELTSFFAFDSTFSGGVVVGTGDINLDGVSDIVAGAGSMNSPSVRIFSVREDIASPSILQEPSPAGFTAGAFVAAGSSVVRSFSVIPSNGSTVVNESRTLDSFDVVLTSRPLSDVVIDLIALDAGEVTLNQLSLRFTPTNWNQRQTVVVTGVRDGAIDGDQQTNVILSINDAESDDAFDSAADLMVAVVTVDQDTQAVIDPALPRFPETDLPVISWTGIPSAASYEVWIARVAPAQSRIFIGSSIVTQTEYTPPAPLDAAVYRIWVRSIGSDNVPGPWSAARTFEIQPTLLAPLTPTFDRRPEFTWEAIPNATAYEIFVRTRNGDIVETNVVGTSWTPTQDLPDGPIRWWVRASESVGNRGYSRPADFSVDGRSSVLAPLGSQTSTSPAFTWQPVVGAGRYILHVQNLDNGQVVIREDHLTDTTHTSSIPLAAGNYRVWVKAINAETNLFSSGTWSRGYDFTVEVVASRQNDLNPLDTITDHLVFEAVNVVAAVNVTAGVNTTELENADARSHVPPPVALEKPHSNAASEFTHSDRCRASPSVFPNKTIDSRDNVDALDEILSDQHQFFDLMDGLTG